MGHCYRFNFVGTSRTRLAAFVLCVQEMSSNNEFKLLLGKLDSVFLQNNWCHFYTYLTFENFKCELDGNIDKYLSAFDSRLHKLKDEN